MEVGDVDLRQDINERLREEVGTSEEKWTPKQKRGSGALEENKWGACGSSRLGRETFRELDPQYEVEAGNASRRTWRGPAAKCRLTDRKNDGLNRRKNSVIAESRLSDLRSIASKKTCSGAGPSARQAAGESTKARTTAEASWRLQSEARGGARAHAAR